MWHELPFADIFLVNAEFLHTAMMLLFSLLVNR